MSLATTIAECQDYLLQTGDVDAMTNAHTDVLRLLGRTMPVWADITVVPDTWVAGVWTQATQTYTDSTANAQGAGTVALSTFNANDGLMVGAKTQFPVLTFILATAHAGGTPVYEWTYWDGHLWHPLACETTPTFASTTTTQTLRFTPPADWAQATPTEVTFPVSMDTALFWLRLRATTPPSTTVAIASLMTMQRAVFPLAETALQLLSAHYMPYELEPILVGESMDLLDPSWRLTTGTPTRYTQDITSTLRLRLVPMPTALPALGIPPFSGIPGAVSSDGYLVTMTLTTPRTDLLPDWMEGVVMLLLTAREAERQGEVMDQALGQACKTTSALVLGMLRALYEAQGLEMDMPWTSERIEEVLT